MNENKKTVVFESPIRARTEAERVAYIEGYAAAVRDASVHGSEVALGSLHAMVSLEPNLKHLVEKGRRL